MEMQELKGRIESGEIDTVIVAVPDVFGRLIGKRFTGKFFLESVAQHGTHACNYLLTVDIEMEPMTGFNLANWEKGFGDFEMQPDLETLRILPWLPGTAIVLCNFCHHHGGAVEESPRAFLRNQVDRLAEKNFVCNIASELEFFLYQNSYRDAWAAKYQDLKPSSDYRIDYHILQPGQDEPLFRAIRNHMGVAEVPVESSKGEWGRGQHEINFTYGQPVQIADRHAIFKHGVREIVAQQGRSVTFMAKPSMLEPGSSCHIHISLWQGKKNAFWDADARAGSSLFRHFLGGLIRYSRELCYFFGPTVNSYKRYQSASWAPTKLAWAFDNRTVGFRVVGEGNSYRIENRMPGADANPYLAFGAMLMAGMAGVDEELDCGNLYEGNAYADSALPALPESLKEAAELLNASEMARRALGDAVVDYYVHTARLEARAFDNSVTDWEHRRYFERI
ncbi:MAG TPA: glutamine synthetase family protein [Candidatus Saccharimonadales bacterium]|nr:glutamine synthetase family protein [Candidatus Saccharimonadales bacterium]